MLNSAQSYRWSLLWAISLHLGIGVMLVWELPTHSYRLSTKHGPTVVQAAAVDAEHVKQTMQAIEQREHAKQSRAARELAQLKHQARLAQQRRDQAAKQVHQLHAAQAKLRAEKQKTAMRLAQMKTRERAQQKAAHQRAIQQAHQRKQQARALRAKQQAIEKSLMAQQLAGEAKRLQQLQTQQLAGEINRYKALILAAIGQQWLVPGGVNKALSCVYQVHLAPGGVVLDVTLLRSSGNVALDQSAKTAIYKASPLPVPHDSRAFDQFRELKLTVSPQTVHS